MLANIIDLATVVSLLEGAANISLVVIAAFSAILAFRVFKIDKDDYDRKLANTLAPLAFESKWVGDMLAQFSSDPILGIDREREYLSFVTRLKISRHQFPKELIKDVEKVLAQSQLFITANRRCRKLMSETEECDALAKAEDGAQFKHKDVQWMWDNRALESEKLLALEEKTNNYLSNVCH